MNICFYAELQQAGPDWTASFPDFPALSIRGTSFWDALARAEAALNAALEEDLTQAKAWPAPTDFRGAQGYFPIQVGTRLLEAYALKKGEPGGVRPDPGPRSEGPGRPGV
jgi:predicted RNase H-like HicB family nuclease